MTGNWSEKALNQLLFIDIETVSGFSEFDELSEAMQEQWRYKADRLSSEYQEDYAVAYRDRAAIYAEFGKVVAIGLGYFHFKSTEEPPSLRLTVLAHHDEQQLLTDFSAMLDKLKQPALRLCGHNAKEFDFPYLCRRFIINRLPLPTVLQIAGRKPWEIPHIDTMELWKFGDYKQYTRLDLLAAVLGIEGSKQAIDGSQVGRVYYEERDLASIAKYCMEDVRVTAQVYLCLMGFEPLPDTQIVRTEPTVASG